MPKKREIGFGYYYERSNALGQKLHRRVIIDVGETGSPEFHAAPVTKVKGKLHISPLPGTETSKEIGRRVGKLTLQQVMDGITRHSGKGMAESIEPSLTLLSKKGKRKL
jgi:hypothetical protein